MKRLLFLVVFACITTITLILSSCEKCSDCEGSYYYYDGDYNYYSGTVTKEFCGSDLKDKRLSSETDVYVDGVGYVDYIFWTCAGN